MHICSPRTALGFLAGLGLVSLGLVPVLGLAVLVLVSLGQVQGLVGLVSLGQVQGLVDQVFPALVPVPVLAVLVSLGQVQDQVLVVLVSLEEVQQVDFGLEVFLHFVVVQQKGSSFVLF